MHALVTDLSKGLGNFLDKPFAIFGHSLGAAIGFELARKLADEYCKSPEILFVSGFPAPQFPRRRPRISALSEPEFRKALREEFDVSPELVENSCLMDFLSPTLRADFRLVENFVPTSGRPVNYPLVAFGGEDDPEASTEEISGWASHAAGSFEMEIFPGGHFFLKNNEVRFLGSMRRHLNRIYS